jgi:hypothetical protein
MVKDTPGPVAVGARGREMRRFLGRQVAEIEVTAFEPPARFALRNRSGPFDLDRTPQPAARRRAPADQLTREFPRTDR